MGILNIRLAEREGARVVIALAGVSGSGKTRSAIELAHGMVKGDMAKVGFIDTENRRGSLYADCIKGEGGKVKQFWIGDLEPPFSPARYIDAIREFEKHGVEVLIIDSVSHEYEGIGGIEEIANADGGKMARWDKAKYAHKRFMSVLLQSNMHIICCIRAREKTRAVMNDKGKNSLESIGVQPIQEKNFMFEMTASLMMWDQGMTQDVMKCPSDLMSFLGRGSGYLTYADGEAIRDWVDGAKKIDPAIEKWKNALKGVTSEGMAKLEECVGKTPAKILEQIEDAFIDSLYAAAEEFDRIAAENSGEIVNNDQSQNWGQ